MVHSLCTHGQSKSWKNGRPFQISYFALCMLYKLVLVPAGHLKCGHVQDQEKRLSRMCSIFTIALHLGLNMQTNEAKVHISVVLGN